MALTIQSKKKIAIIFFLITGVTGTFAYKLQGSQIVSEGQYTHKHFFHPYIQSLTMFIGEALCLIFYFAQGKKAKKQLQEGKKPHTPIIFLIPAASDTLSSILQYMGLSFIAGSTYVMFKGASIITTAIFSRILVKMVIQKRHLAGCGFAILGLMIVGSSGFFGSSGGDSTFSKQFVGYILMLCSLIFNGFFYAYEQRLLKKHTIHPLEMVGFEGCFGICIVTILITILSYIPCGFGEKGCVYDDDNNAFMELPRVFLRQFADNYLLIIFFILGIITIGAYNFCGVSITKFYDALTRSLLNITKTSLIWIIGIVITLLATSDEYKIESLDPVVNAIKAVGFVLIIIGTLIYNKLIFKKFFQTSVQGRSLLSEELSNSQGSIQSNTK